MARGIFVPMVGKKYGHLLVLAEAGRRVSPSGQTARLVRVRCDCGREYETRAAELRYRVNRCLECKKKWGAQYARAEMSVRLPGGRTVAQVAQAAGLSLGTVYRRFLRGWPVAKLGAPLQARGARRKGYGGSVDVPERRNTRYPSQQRAEA